MRILVVSNAMSRRTDYLIKAGRHVGVDTCFITYEELLSRFSSLRDVVLKLEPPVFGEAALSVCDRLCAAYRETLQTMEARSLPGGVSYMNTPAAILRALDKAETKRLLSLRGIPITPLLAVDISGFEELRTIAASTPQGIFLKPRYGSGAGGVMALRYHTARRKWVAYTTMEAAAGIVYNTRRIFRLTDESAIAALSGAVFPGGSVVEGWIPKERFEGVNYDLRLVCREGTVDYAVARCSDGAITNLHLNNQPRLFDELRLPDRLREELFRQSLRSTQALGLAYAGVDALIARGTESPYIIEVNGQGDHIYQDMFADNRIYINQLKSIRERNDK